LGWRPVIFFAIQLYMEELVIRKRVITTDDIKFIQSVVHDNWDKSRTQISKIICTEWGWRQPNGQLKDMACREILLTLHRKGLLDYPPPRQPCTNGNKRQPYKIDIDRTPLCCPISGLKPVKIEMVRHTNKEPLYNALVDNFHYLGHSQIIGNHLKYITFSGDRPIACIGWGSAAWAVNAREQYIGWTKEIKDQRLHFIANNTRYAILPWVSVKCLASKIMALNIKRISADWHQIYKTPLYMLETFVEQDRFKGTCYKASNWIRVGQTIGTSKKGHKHLRHGKVKDVYLYPLHKNYKSLLNRDTS
jgi:hypothetical protein